MHPLGEIRMDPGHIAGCDDHSELEVVVPYTGPESTSAALERVANLTAGLNARVLLVAVHALPYPLPFACPSCMHAHLVERLMELAGVCALPVQPQVVLARDL